MPYVIDSLRYIQANCQAISLTFNNAAIIHKSCIIEGKGDGLKMALGIPSDGLSKPEDHQVSENSGSHTDVH